MTHRIQGEQEEMLKFSKMIKKLEEVRKAVEEYNLQILQNLPDEAANDEVFEENQKSAA